MSKGSQASVLQQQWSSLTQAVRKKWTTPGRDDEPSHNETGDSECLLVLEGGSRSVNHRHRHSSSPRAPGSSSGKVRLNPLLTEAALQLPRFIPSPPRNMEQEQALCSQHSDCVQESHNPLLSEISLRLPVSRVSVPCGRRDDPVREPHSYVLIGPDGQARSSLPGMGPSACCSGDCCCIPRCCKCERSRVYGCVKALLILVLLAILVALIVFFSRKNQIFKLLQWTDKHKIKGAAIFAFLYVICTVLFVPVLPLAIGGGAVYGVLLGSVIVWVGATAGETIAFLIGRFLLRDLVKSKAAKMPIWLAVERAIRYEGWKIILLLRLAPMVPFALVNYFLGASAARFSQFFWASILGIIPGIIVNVYLGSTIRQMIVIAHSPEDPPQSIHVHTPKSVQITIIVVSAVAVVSALLLIGLYARRELLKIMNAHQPTEPSSPSSTSAQLQEHLPHPSTGSTGSHSRSSSIAAADSVSLDAPQPVEMSHTSLS